MVLMPQIMGQLCTGFMQQKNLARSGRFFAENPCNIKLKCTFFPLEGEAAI
jgi:hypothetical protein